MRQAGVGHWWKRREAAIVAFGLTMEEADNDIFQQQRYRAVATADFPLPAFLQELHDVDLAGDDIQPFLYGQALIAAAKAVDACAAGGAAAAETLDLAVPFLEASGNALAGDVPPAAKLCACRALGRLLPAVKKAGGGSERGSALLGQYVPPLLEALCTLMHRCGPPQHGLPSKTMTLTTSDCGATRSLSIKRP